MRGWRTGLTVGGLDWLVAGSPTEQGLAEVGLVIGHRYAHESPAQLGIGALAVAAAAREVGRPRETTDHRVIEPQVAAQVDLTQTVFRIIGDREALRVAISALDETLRDPSQVELDDLVRPAPFGWTGWTEELTAWFGMGPVGFAAEESAEWSGPADELRNFLRRLHPAQGVPAVAWTTDPDLVGAAFTSVLPGPGRPAAGTDALSWRQPAPTDAGPAALTATYANNLFAVRAPATLANELAVALLLRTAHRNLVDFGHLVAGLQLSSVRVAPDKLWAVRAVPDQRGYDADATRRALTHVFEAYRSFPDSVLATEIERARSPEGLPADLTPARRAMDALQSGRRPTAVELLASWMLSASKACRQRSGRCGMGCCSVSRRASDRHRIADRPILTRRPRSSARP